MLCLYTVFDQIISLLQRRNLRAIIIKITILSLFELNCKLYLKVFMVDFVSSIGNKYLAFNLCDQFRKLVVSLIHKQSFTYQQCFFIVKIKLACINDPMIVSNKNNILLLDNVVLVNLATKSPLNFPQQTLYSDLKLIHTKEGGGYKGR